MTFIREGGSGSSATGNIWVVDSSVASSAYPNNVRYVPLGSGASDYVEFQLAAAGDVTLQLVYAMSGASANDVTLRLDSLIMSAGTDPSQAATVGTPFTVTPGNDVLWHATTGAESSDLSLTVSDGDLVYVRVTRTDATHPGDFRLIEMRLT